MKHDKNLLMPYRLYRLMVVNVDEHIWTEQRNAIKVQGERERARAS